MSTHPSRRAFLAGAAGVAGMSGALGAARQAAGSPAAQQATPQPAQEPEDRSQTFSLDVTRVNLLFTVSDKKGRFVTNLVMEDFEVLESRKKQKILEFATESDLPLRIAILVDTSNSIRARFRFEVEAAQAFLEGVLRKGQDKALVYGFDTEAEMVQDFTDDTELLGQKLRDLRPGGGTALFDAMVASCRDKLMQERPLHKFRRAMVMISDGEDNASHYTRDQALEYAQKTDVVIYAISTSNTGSMHDQEAGMGGVHMLSDGDKVLKYLTRETGGMTYFPFRAQDMEQDFENIANELRSQYSILYRPEPLKTDGLYHPIEVRVHMRNDLIIRARSGYYAPRT
ncbi:MAG: VWA domain-containing protein [Bryobacteraceae bacterium]